MDAVIPFLLLYFNSQLCFFIFYQKNYAFSQLALLYSHGLPISLTHDPGIVSSTISIKESTPVRCSASNCYKHVYYIQKFSICCWFAQVIHTQLPLLPYYQTPLHPGFHLAMLSLCMFVSSFKVQMTDYYTSELALDVFWITDFCFSPLYIMFGCICISLHVLFYPSFLNLLNVPHGCISLQLTFI